MERTLVKSPHKTLNFYMVMRSDNKNNLVVPLLEPSGNIRLIKSLLIKSDMQFVDKVRLFKTVKNKFCFFPAK